MLRHWAQTICSGKGGDAKAKGTLIKVGMLLLGLIILSQQQFIENPVKMGEK